MTHGHVAQKGLGDRRGDRKARGLDQDAVELAGLGLAQVEVLDERGEIVANGAAEAAVVQLEDVVVRLKMTSGKQVVDADLAQEIPFPTATFKLRSNATKESASEGTLQASVSAVTN